MKVSATDPDSRLLPAKNGGGYVQGWNLQLTAARRQILLAVELHDNPDDCGALITMIETAAANCEQAGLREQIRAWLADNGYASAANFKALEHLMLLVAVSRRGQPDRPRRRRPDHACRPAGRRWPPGWPPRPGRSCISAAPPRSSRPSPSSSRGSAAKSTTAAATPSTPRSSSWAPCTTSPSCSATGAGTWPLPPPDREHTQPRPPIPAPPGRRSSMPAQTAASRQAPAGTPARPHHPPERYPAGTIRTRRRLQDPEPGARAPREIVALQPLV